MNPSAAQLRARRNFAKMARERARLIREGKLKPKRRKKNANSIAQTIRRGVRNVVRKVKGKKKAAPVGYSKTQRGKKRVARVGYRKTQRGRTVNPGKQHLPGLPARYQRMYEDILTKAQSDDRYRGREKEVAARTTIKRAAEDGVIRAKNPFGEYVLAPIGGAIGGTVVSLFSHHKRHKKRVKVSGRRGSGYVEVTANKRRGLARKAKRAQREASRLFNPSTEEMFERFRGKQVDGSVNMKVPDGTPRLLAEAGRLVDLTLVDGRIVAPSGAVVLMDKNERIHFGGNYRVGVKGKQRGVEQDLGPVRKICYFTDKPHIDKSGRSAAYEHKFESPLPHLVLDHENLMRLEGGSYSITERGIEH